MRYTTVRTPVAIGVIGGLVSLAAVGGLLARADYHAVTSVADWWLLGPGSFLLGFVTVAISAHTRLLAPGGGFLALLAGVVIVEFTTPTPAQTGELGGAAIIDGSISALSYAVTWYVWLALLLVAGVAEFAIRRGYGLGDDRLRNLPELPLSRRRRLTAVVGGSVAVGLATAASLAAGTLWDSVPGYAFGFAAATVATAVPLAAVLARGLLTPFVLYVWVVTGTLRVEIFGTPDGGFHVVFLGASSLAFALLAAVELFARSRLLGWDGGRFVGSPRLEQ